MLPFLVYSIMSRDRVFAKMEGITEVKQESSSVLFLMMTHILLVRMFLGIITRFLLASIRCIDEVLEPCPPFFVALAGLGEPFADAECGNGVTLVLERKVGVGAPNKDGSSGEYDVELGIDGAIGLEGDGPDDNDDNSNGDFHQRGYGVGTTIV